MQINPIVKKDVRVQARSMRICWELFAYEAIMAIVFFVAISVIQMNLRYSYGNIYSSILWLYPVLAVAQIGVLGVVVPIRTASAISGEKERQTFDIMMTTSMTPFSIVMGKVMTAIVREMFFVTASLPVMALAFVIGGLSWTYLLWFFAIALLVSFFCASIGIFCSSLCKKTITAVIMAYGFYVIFFAGTYIPLAVEQSYHYMNGTRMFGAPYMSLSLLLNPAAFLLEFFVRVMTGKSFMQDVSGVQPTGHGLMEFITSGYWWLVISYVMFVAVSFLFLWLAAVRINPRRGSR